MRTAIAGALVVVAAVLALSVALPGAYQPTGVAPIASADATGSARITSTGSGDTRKYILSTLIAGDTAETSFAANAATSTVHDGLPALLWSKSTTGTLNNPATLTLDQLVQLTGGRLPIGMSASQNPGPFDAKWTNAGTSAVWVSNGSLLDANRSSTIILTLSGGGLLTTRTLTPSADADDSSSVWHVTTAYRDSFVAGTASVAKQASELLLWKLWIPLVLAAAALVLCGYALKARLTFARKSRPKTVTKETYA